MQEKPELGPGVGSRVLDTLALPKVRREIPAQRGCRRERSFCPQVGLVHPEPPPGLLQGHMGLLCEPLGGAPGVWKGCGAAKGLEGEDLSSSAPSKVPMCPVEPEI